MMKLEIGKKAPEFEAFAHIGKSIKLSDFQGKIVVLYFYPKDMTPGCTLEACDFRDQYTQFEKLNAVVIGVSADPIERHQKFVEKYDLPFYLVTDDEHKISQAYGVWKKKKMFGKDFLGIERSTFVIDNNGKLRKEWRKVKVNGHVEEVLEFVKELSIE